MSTLKKTLYAYSIMDSSATRRTCDFRDKLFMLQEDKDKNTIGKRKLKDGDSNKYDVLLYYDINKATKRCFGVMVKYESKNIQPKITNQISGEKWNIIENEDINKEIVKTLETESTFEISFNDVYYFMVDNAHLVITLPLKRISEFEKYINWIFNDYEFSDVYNFNLILHSELIKSGIEISRVNDDGKFQKQVFSDEETITNIIRNSYEGMPITINSNKENKTLKDLFKNKVLHINTNDLSIDVVEFFRQKMNEFLTEIKNI